jgi:hypothetical protein
MVKKQTRCKNQIKSILHFYGIQIPEELANGHWSKRFIAWIETIRMEWASGNFTLKVHLEELNHMRKIIAELPVLFVLFPTARSTGKTFVY